MGLTTWQVKVSEGLTGRTHINVKAKKDTAENFRHKLHPLLNIYQYHTEIRGVIGGAEDRTTFMSMFTPSGAPVREEQAWRDETRALFDSLPDPVTDTDIPGILKRVNEIFRAHVPIKDSRETPEAVEKREAERKAIQEKLAADDAAWRAEWALPEDVPVPDGMMVVTLEITFDDSDAMTDYFHPHSAIGHPLLIAIIPKQPQTERLCRTIMEQYPELAQHTWTWHTENYSGGHGNYLMSEWTDNLVPQRAYNGRHEVNTRYEIRCNPYKGGKAVMAYKHYDQALFAATSTPTECVNGTGSASYTLNDAKNGVEIKFASRPNDETLGTLKAYGFRWSMRQHLWYARQSSNTIEVAKRICGEQAAA